MSFERRFPDGAVVNERSTMYGPILFCTCPDYQKPQPQTPHCCAHIDSINAEFGKSCSDCKAKDKKIADLELSIKCGSTRELNMIRRMEAIEERGIRNCFILGAPIERIAEIWGLPLSTVKEILKITPAPAEGP